MAPSLSVMSNSYKTSLSLTLNYQSKEALGLLTGNKVEILSPFNNSWVGFTPNIWSSSNGKIYGYFNWPFDFSTESMQVYIFN